VAASASTGPPETPRPVTEGPLDASPARRTTSRCRSSILPAAIALVAALATGARAGEPAVPYQLEAGSSYDVGCNGPCDCAVTRYPLSGTFELRRVDENPLYTTYAVEAFAVAFERAGRTVTIVGTGEYRHGGEVAIQHQLQLDVAIDGDTHLLFDSGWVGGGSEFPEIRIATAAWQFACIDTVISLVARPATAGVDPFASAAARAVPNPFHALTELRFALARAAAADVVILDGQGRAVRTLLARAPLGAGDHRVGWDGRADDGSTARPGVYIARVRAGERVWHRRLIKLGAR
jgi:hypothetical protein